MPKLHARGLGAAAAAALLAACGGGGDGGGGGRLPIGTQVVPDIPPSDPEAARFLAQAAFGGTRAEVQALRAQGYRAWLEDQFLRPRGQGHYDWLMANGYGAEANRFNTAGLDNTIWRKLLAGTDPLRQRVSFALSQLLVVSVNGVTSDWPQFAVAHYLDILEEHAFGNYRGLLRAVTLSTAMGQYLTYRGNRKASTSGSVPDENYARELMQLFTIGLVQLQPDGTPQPGCPVENAVRIQDASVGLSSSFMATCPLAVSFALFERHGLQPAAQAVFGQPVSHVEHVGSFACRRIAGSQRPSQASGLSRGMRKNR